MRFPQSAIKQLEKQLVALRKSDKTKNVQVGQDGTDGSYLEVDVPNHRAQRAIKAEIQRLKNQIALTHDNSR